MTNKEETEAPNSEEVEVDKFANNIRFEDSNLFEHFLSVDVGDQIALLSSMLHICAKMDAHLQEVMEKEMAAMEDDLIKITEILKGSEPDSN
tara:strand:- start:168 stop:443 length:276 start_codon:yes stop_codon:yes gene_type:complete